MIDVFVSTGERQGFDLNALKTTVRLFRAEYLKKEEIYGYSIPLQHVSMFGSENEKQFFPIDLMISYASTLNVKVSRGMDPGLATRLVMATWNVKRAVRIDGDVSVNFYLPFCSIMVPKSSNGAGLMPWNIIGANVDLACMFIANYYGFLPYIEAAYSLLSVDSTLTRSLIASRLVDENESDLVSPVNPFGKGIRYAREVKNSVYSNKLANASVALNWLRERGFGGIVPDNLNILNMEFTIAKSSILDNSTIRSLVPIEKARRGRLMIQRAALGTEKQIDRYEWVRVLAQQRIYEGEVDVVSNHSLPFWYYNDELKNVIDSIGVGFTDRFRFSSSNILNSLRRDPRFPRYINEDVIVNLLSDERLLTDLNIMYYTLIAIGGRPDIVESIVNRVRSSLERYSLMDSGSGISLRDQSLSMLNVSTDTILRFCDISTGKPSFDTLIAYLMMSVSIVLYKGGLKHWTVRFRDSSSLKSIFDMVSGGFLNNNDFAIDSPFVES
jgi:hypothetical protein